MNKYIILIHGGAGKIKPEEKNHKCDKYRESLKSVLATGNEILKNGGTAVDSVTKAVRIMEDEPVFNAGNGSVYTAEETHELDAAIMDGKTLKSGAVAGVSKIKNPVLLARAIMEKSEWMILRGKGAEAFARKYGIEEVEPEYFDTELRYQQLLKFKEKSIQSQNREQEKLRSTVGAVALDRSGNLAAANSTGGITNKPPGRIGDTPLIGIGTYANNKTCAVACSGKGEELIRQMTAYELHARMIYKGLSLHQAAIELIEELPPEAGGFIAVDNYGNFVMPFNTLGMYRGYADNKGMVKVGIWNDME